MLLTCDVFVKDARGELFQKIIPKIAFDLKEEASSLPVWLCKNYILVEGPRKQLTYETSLEIDEKQSTF